MWADVEHMCNTEGRAEEGIPYLHPVQFCLTNLQHMLADLGDGVCAHAKLVGHLKCNKPWKIFVLLCGSLRFFKLKLIFKYNTNIVAGMTFKILVMLSVTSCVCLVFCRLLTNFEIVAKKILNSIAIYTRTMGAPKLEQMFKEGRADKCLKVR